MVTRLFIGAHLGVQSPGELVRHGLDLKISKLGSGMNRGIECCGRGRRYVHSAAQVPQREAATCVQSYAGSAEPRRPNVWRKIVNFVGRGPASNQ